MRTTHSLFCIACFLLSTFPTLAQTTLAQWTFETSPPADLNNSTNITGLTADFGTGTASGLHAGAGTDWSTPAGNGSANSLSVNTWAPGDFFQFQTSTLGFDNISVSFDITRSSTGPTNFSLSYSTDGSLFTIFGTSFFVLTNGASANNSGTGLATSDWAPSGGRQSPFSIAIDLTSVSSLNNAPSVFIRIEDASTATAATGTVRIDNVAVTTVPEPGTVTLVIGGLLGLGWLRHRRRPR